MHQIPIKMIGNIQKVYMECNEIISELQREIDALTVALEQLQTRINGLKNELNWVLDEIKRREQNIACLERERQGYYNQIAGLQAELHALYASNENGNNSSAIAAVEGQIQQLYAAIKKCNEKISSEYYEIKILDAKRVSLEREIYRCEMELMELEAEKRRKLDKMYRLKSAYARVRQEFEQLQAVVKAFQYRTLESTSGNIAGIDQCIAAIEEYMSV